MSTRAKASRKRRFGGDHRRLSANRDAAALWFLDRDNLNTDGIYAGKHTYNDAMTPEQMAAVIFENYDPNFNALKPNRRRHRRRLQLRHRLVARAGGHRAEVLRHPVRHRRELFSETYKRNAFNNGFVVFECPELVEHLRATLTIARRRSIGVGEIEIDYGKSAL